MPTNELILEQRKKQLKKILKKIKFPYFLSPSNDLYIKSKLHFGLSGKFIQSLNEIINILAIVVVKGNKNVKKDWGDEYEFKKLKKDEGLLMIVFSYKS